MKSTGQKLTVDSLTALDIDFLSEKTAEILQDEMKLDRKEVLRLRLSVEEVLLLWREAFGEDTGLSLRYGKRLGRPFIELALAGKRFNPYEQYEEGLGSREDVQNMLAFYGLTPAYSYVDGVNCLTLMPKRRKTGTIQKMLGSFAAAVLVGLLCGFLPDAVRSGLAKQVLQPLFNTFMSVLSAISGPLIFLSVLWGIYAIGDVSMLGRIGKKMVLRFVAFTFVILSLCAAGTFWMFELNFDGVQKTQNQFAEIYAMILDIVPPNIVVPFSEGNSLQIIFLAVVVGLAMLILRDKITVMAECVEQVNYIVQLIMDAVGTLVPTFVFISVLNMMLTGMLLTAISSLKEIVVCAVGCAAAVLLYALWISLTKKVSWIGILKKLFPTMLIALTTASSAAAYGTNLETCEKKLGIDKRIVNFGLPLGQVVFMPGGGIMFLTMAFMMAEYAQVAVSLSWVVMAVIVASLLAIAAPPIPGGGLSVYTILFLQLGIPMETLTLALALNTIIEFFGTAANLACLQMELTLVADKMGMLDTEVLHKTVEKS